MKSSKEQGESYNTGFVYSINAALEGIVHTLQSERNMRLHFLAGFLVLIAGVYFGLAPVEFMLLCFAVSFVLVAEMFNTVVEHAVDFISKRYDPLSKIIKDISAGAVFVSAVNASVVGYMLLLRRVGWHFGKIFFTIKRSPWNITLIVLLVVVGLVLLIKVLRKEKSLLRGGMPSGHTAVAFSVWMIISLMTENIFVSLMVLFMAVLIAKSRLAGKIHTLWEVLAGGALGSLVTLLVYQLLT